MMDIIKNATSALGSASKIVLISFSWTLCAGLLIGVVDLQTFNNAAMIVLGAYFARNQIGGTEASK